MVGMSIEAMNVVTSIETMNALMSIETTKFVMSIETTDVVMSVACLLTSHPASPQISRCSRSSPA